MAVEYLYTTHTGTTSGGGWSLRSATNTRTATTSDNNGTGPQHQCNTGAGNSGNYGLDNFTGPAASFSSVQVYHRVRRTGTTDNSTIAQRMYRDSEWWTGTARNAVNSTYLETVTAPGFGGWTDAIINAALIDWIYDEPTGTSSEYLYFDYVQYRVNYTPTGGSVSIWSMPWLGALPFIEDFIRAFQFYHRTWDGLVKHGLSLREYVTVQRELTYPRFFDMGGTPCLT